MNSQQIEKVAKAAIVSKYIRGGYYDQHSSERIRLIKKAIRNFHIPHKEEEIAHVLAYTDYSVTLMLKNGHTEEYTNPHKSVSPPYFLHVENEDILGTFREHRKLLRGARCESLLTKIGFTA